MSAKDQIIALIPKLKASEVGAIRAALSDMRGAESKKITETDLSDDWLLDGLVSYMVDKGMLTSRGALSVIKRRSAYEVYTSRRPEVMKYLTKIETQLHTVSRHRTRLGTLCARSLYELLKARKMLSVGTMFSQIDKIPEALESAYPGYIEAGLFAYVLTASVPQTE